MPGIEIFRRNLTERLREAVHPEHLERVEPFVEYFMVKNGSPLHSSISRDINRSSNEFQKLKINIASLCTGRKKGEYGNPELTEEKAKTIYDKVEGLLDFESLKRRIADETLWEAVKLQKRFRKEQ